MPFPPPKKKRGDLALLMAEPEPTDPLDDEDDPEGDLTGDFDDEDTDPLAALDEGGSDSSIPPEQAALCETLGFTDPEQQQALIDLVKLVNSTDPMATESSNSLPPLPESTY